MSFKVAREKAGLTQMEVAKQLKIPQSTITSWETDRELPRAHKLKDIAALYGCTVDELLEEK